MKNKSFTKIHIVKNLSDISGFSILFSKKLINDFIEILIENIKEKELNLMNIGSFKKKKKNERIGRNPKTNEEYIITQRNSLSFIPSKKLLSILNQDK